MTPEDQKRMVELCVMIQTETDPKKFTQLVYDLNVLLEARYVDVRTNGPAVTGEHKAAG